MIKQRWLNIQAFSEWEQESNVHGGKLEFGWLIKKGGIKRGARGGEEEGGGQEGEEVFRRGGRR